MTEREQLQDVRRLIEVLHGDVMALREARDRMGQAGYEHGRDVGQHMERDACAQIAEEFPALAGCDGGVTRALADDIAAAIRARGSR